jgi:hypothetical protein
MKTIFFLLFSLCLSTGLANSHDDQIALYASPHASSPLRYLSADTKLVPIYHEKEWVKVGNPSTGNVGWVNTIQVGMARDHFYRPAIQTIYLSSKKGPNGKPLISIVAYLNGKKLSNQEAKARYEAIRAEQMRETTLRQELTRFMAPDLLGDFNGNVFAMPLSARAMTLSPSITLPAL